MRLYNELHTNRVKIKPLGKLFSKKLVFFLPYLGKCKKKKCAAEPIKIIFNEVESIFLLYYIRIIICNIIKTNLINYRFENNRSQS